MSDKSQTKVALYAFLFLMLLGVLAPFALVGRATAPAQARTADLTPRESLTTACKAFVRANAGTPDVSWQHVDEWQIFKLDNGNYKIFMQWTVGNRNYIRACIVQPVNGSWQVVSVK